MRLEIASRKAIEYACMNFHYAKSIPVNPFAFSVFNDENEWCGCILYGLGANKNMAVEFGLSQGQVAELTRVALNGLHGITGKTVSLSIKLLHKKSKALRLLVSYADKGQDHYGTIYQATNWSYVGESNSSGQEVFLNGKWVHRKTYDSMSKKPANVITRSKSGKHKYLYPLTKEMKELCEKIKKPYPKRVQNIDSDVPPIQEEKAVQV